MRTFTVSESAGATTRLGTPSPSGTMIHFVNQVAEAVEDEFPDKFVGTLAYQYTFGGFSAGEDDRFIQLSGWIPGKTPYGDDVDISFHSIGVYLGISGSF